MGRRSRRRRPNRGVRSDGPRILSVLVDIGRILGTVIVVLSHLIRDHMA